MCRVVRARVPISVPEHAATRPRLVGRRHPCGQRNLSDHGMPRVPHPWRVNGMKVVELAPNERGRIQSRTTRPRLPNTRHACLGRVRRVPQLRHQRRPTARANRSGWHARSRGSCASGRGGGACQAASWGGRAAGLGQPLKHPRHLLTAPIPAPGRGRDAAPI